MSHELRIYPHPHWESPEKFRILFEAPNFDLYLWITKDFNLDSFQILYDDNHCLLGSASMGIKFKSGTHNNSRFGLFNRALSLWTPASVKTKIKEFILTMQFSNLNPTLNHLKTMSQNMLWSKWGFTDNEKDYLNSLIAPEISREI